MVAPQMLEPLGARKEMGSDSIFTDTCQEKEILKMESDPISCGKRRR